MDFNGIYCTGNIYVCVVYIYIYVYVCSGYTCVCVNMYVCVCIYRIERERRVPTGKLAYHWKIIMLDR